jgi:hypothetical protein
MNTFGIDWAGCVRPVHWTIRTDMASILLETLSGWRPGHARNHAVRPHIETSLARSCLLPKGDKHAPEEWLT